LGLGCLLTGTRLDPSLVSQLCKEIQTADRVDVLCSFIKWSGIRILEEALGSFAAQPRARLRVITTSYLGATDLKAIDLLRALPAAEVRVSYDTHRTRLHAKAYLFHRETGFGCAYIGSANLSHAALTDGLEGNVKISQYESPHLWERVTAMRQTQRHRKPDLGADRGHSALDRRCHNKQYCAALSRQLRLDDTAGRIRFHVSSSPK
jgi:HKD family nuclease